MVRVKEPHIYSGYVKSLIGLTAGNRVPMDLKVAQGLVSMGQAAWDDDETPLGKSLQGAIDATAAERERIRLEDDEIGKVAKAQSVEALLTATARPIHITTGEDGKIYLARPFPRIAIVTKEEGMSIMGEAFAIVAQPDHSEESQTRISFENASAVYKVIDVSEERIVLEGVEADQFEGEIPADWRELHHLKYIPIAKEIRRTPDGESMKADQARAVLEEWTKQDDQIPVDHANAIDGGVRKGEGEDAGNRLPGADAEAAKKAEEDAKNLGTEDDN